MLAIRQLVLLSAATIAASLHAQSALVIPPGFDQVDGATRGKVAGFEARLRQQIIVRGSDLQALEGRQLTSLWFRRDYMLGLNYGSSTSSLRVRMSPARTTPLSASPVFSRNETAPATVVFDGVVVLPGSQPVPGAAPWVPPHAVELELTGGYVHQSGALCIDIEGTPQSPPPSFFWSVDYENEADMGTVVPVGSPCGVATARFRNTLGAWGRNIIPGGTFAVSAVGVPNSPGVLMLGMATNPVSLDSIGASGCTLYVQPLALFGGTHGVPISIPGYSGLDTSVTVPTDTTLLNGRFWVQAVNIEVPMQSNSVGVTTTNALDITIAGSLPRGSVTTILSAEVGYRDPLPASGRVELARGPVMRLEYQ